jgi:hypothetical protein
MKGGRPIAVGLVWVCLLGAEERLTASALDGAGHDSGVIAHDAGPLGGTILHEQERGGYVALGARQPIVLRRPYRGGPVGDYV